MRCTPLAAGSAARPGSPRRSRCWWRSRCTRSSTTALVTSLLVIARAVGAWADRN